ncbi:hypothetical protein HPB51_015438 [Rhipicephalus microplus]|uniref:beta-N-acetylhexosaminidase n=1 Tax=Rhipicephalus microplus TaxID=6941 RepID=A0A9J6DVY6_RHIMP|nr:hypothetical protein HPB51_015438 [Rhipicephalus microplus]
MATRAARTPAEQLQRSANGAEAWRARVYVSRHRRNVLLRMREALQLNAPLAVFTTFPFVHLDLKGAAFKVSYYEQFVLKRPKFFEFREVARYPNVLCPSHPKSSSLIEEMVTQVMQLHSDSQWFHLGADEVWHLGQCERCRTVMVDKQWGKDHLYVDYLSRIVGTLHKKYPMLKFIVWDDMMRDMDPQIITGAGLHHLVEPMVWHYFPQSEFRLKQSLTSEALTEVSQSIGYFGNIEMEVFPRPQAVPPVPNFPGGKLHVSVLHLSNVIAELEQVLLNPSVQGGFHEFLVAHNRTNPLHVDQFVNTARKLLVNIESLYRDITKELSDIYYQSTVEEWLSTYISPYREKLKKLVSDADLQIAVNVPM